MVERKRIYLAGKIGGTDWRYPIVKGLASTIKRPDFHQKCRADGWPVLERAIFNRFDYVGPYFMHFLPPRDSFFQGHGYDWETVGYKSHDDYWGRSEVVNRCWGGLCASNLVFVWLNSPDAYGSLIELGMAYTLSAVSQNQLLKHPYDVAVAVLENAEWTDDLWFAQYLKGVAPYRVSEEHVSDALRDCLINLGWFFDSPLEEAFWTQWKKTYHHPTLEVQYEVLNGKYRLDFAHLPTKTAIELDGFEYHNDKAQFTRDRKRQRELEREGWRVIRFSGSEIHKDVVKCVDEALAMIQQQ